MHALPYIKLLDNRAGPQMYGVAQRLSVYLGEHILSPINRRVLHFMCRARRSREARLHQAAVKRSNQISTECVWVAQQTSTKSLRETVRERERPSLRVSEELKLKNCLVEVAQGSLL